MPETYVKPIKRVDSYAGGIPCIAGGMPCIMGGTPGIIGGIPGTIREKA